MRKNVPFLVSAVLLWMLVCLVYARYRNYVDPDATAYLTIVRRYAEGEWLQAINGYWSPLSCWIAALLVHSGLGLMPAAVATNTLAATGVLACTVSLGRVFGLSRRMSWLVPLTMAMFLCYAVYKQLFSDLWQVFLLLSVLLMLFRPGFSAKPALWLLTGLLGALAYMGKAYAFTFFILNILCCLLLLTGASRPGQRGLWLRISGITIGTMICCSMPWIYALHHKYGFWTTGTAGGLNLSWYLVGHPYWRANIAALLPPIYADSTFYWEDPYQVNGATPHCWNSLALLKLQCVRIPYNLMKLFNCLNELSPLFLAIILGSKCLLLVKQLRMQIPLKMRVALLSMLLFPVAFLLINFEARYIWYMLPIGMVTCAWVFERVMGYLQLHRYIQTAILFPFSFTFISFPVWDMKAMYRVGQSDRLIAQQLQAAGIKGPFIANCQSGAATQSILRIAYFSGNSYYALCDPAMPLQAVLNDAHRYHVPYYYYRYAPLEGDHYHVTDTLGIPYPVVYDDPEAGLKVFALEAGH